jgi:hypothetical protein
MIWIKGHRRQTGVDGKPNHHLQELRMLKFSLALAFLASLTSVAVADQVTVTNDTNDTVFKLYAWPTNLSPRTMNIVGFPIFPGASAKVDVDNAYGDCVFQIQTDINNPADAKKPRHKPKPALFKIVNLCQDQNKVSLKPDEDEDKNGQ